MSVYYSHRDGVNVRSPFSHTRMTQIIACCPIPTTACN